MAFGTGRGTPILASVVCGVVLAAGPTVRAEEPHRNPESYVLIEFAGDLREPWTETAPYRADVLEPRTFRSVETLPEFFRKKVAALVPGLTRMAVERLGWLENAGATMNEFVIADLRRDGPFDGRPGYLAVRIVLRPAAMPVEVYADPDQRQAWLREQRPGPDPRDVIVRVSKPFVSRCIAD